MMCHPPKAFSDLFFSPFKELPAVVFLAFVLILPLSCHGVSDQFRQREAPRQGIENIAVFGFKAALSKKDSPGYFRCPICGATFMAEPVPVNVAEKLTADLAALLNNVTKFSLIPPMQVRRAHSALFSQERDVLEMVQETGRSLSAEAVLFGYIYRWKERAGTSYSIESAAYVALDLHLINPVDGSIVWRGSFNKTQRSLSENLLDFSTFILSGGKWLTAQELARIGLEKLIRQMEASL